MHKKSVSNNNNNNLGVDIWESLVNMSFDVISQTILGDNDSIDILGDSFRDLLSAFQNPLQFSFLPVYDI